MNLSIPTKLCKTCGINFPKLKTTSKRVWELQKFCSIGCSNTLIRKGEPLPVYIKAGMDGRFKRVAEQKQKGVLNNNWKGGVSYGFIKKTALIRDNYTCQVCGLRELEIMEVDHIKPKPLFPELFREIRNLVTLCPNCHRRKTNRELKECGQSPINQFNVKGY